MYHGSVSTRLPDKWVSWTNSGGSITISSTGGSWLISLTCYNPARDPNWCIVYRDSGDALMNTVPNNVFTEATNALAPYLS